MTVDDNGCLTAYDGEERRVVIPDTVCKLSEGVFQGNETLEEVVIPERVTEIPKRCFEGCTNLTRVTFGGPIRRIVWRAFADCRRLEAIDVPEGLESVGIEAFEHCESLRGITLPSTVKQIAHKAFAGCRRLHTVQVSGIPQVAGTAFDGTMWLDRGRGAIRLGDGLYRYRGTDAVYTVPSDIRAVYTDAFSGVLTLREVILPPALERIDSGAFSLCKSLCRLHIPDAVHTVGACACFGCDALTDVTLPVGLTVLESGSFAGCVQLEHLTLPPRLRTVSRAAFNGCRSLAEVTLPDTLVYIGETAFRGCEALDAVHIPDGVERIEDRAFADCKALRRIKVPPQPLLIGNDVLAGCMALEGFDGNDKMIRALWWRTDSDVRVAYVCRLLRREATLRVWEEQFVQSQMTSLSRQAVEAGDIELLTSLLDGRERLSLTRLDELDGAAGGQPSVTAFLLEYRHRRYTLEEIAAHEASKQEW